MQNSEDGAVTAAGDGLISRVSAHSVSETMDRLEAAAQEKGLKVFLRLNHAEGAAGAGLDLRPTQLLLFGNPQGGTPLMQSAQSAGIDLPLKAVVYETAEGRVMLTYNDPAWLAARHGIGDRDQVIAKMTGLLSGLADTATN